MTIKGRVTRLEKHAKPDPRRAIAIVDEQAKLALVDGQQMTLDEFYRRYGRPENPVRVGIDLSRL